MINMQDFIESKGFFKKLKVDDLLFVEFKCPTDETADSVWWHNNLFAYVLTGETKLKSMAGEYTLREGDCVFAKKGSITIQSHIQENFCELMVFVPDNFIRTTIQKYNVSLISGDVPVNSDTIIPLSNDEILDSYFHSLAAYFAQNDPPNPVLLKLKFEELVVSIISRYKKYIALNQYFRQICASEKPSVREIMESNFSKNMSLEEFARLCARSLSSFKSEFKEHFHTSPGKWLTDKRLEYGRFLLETYHYSIDEICMMSGFENTSHFIRVFKNKYHTPPGRFRKKSTQ
jgi:AraC family transcriptional regulator, exoenzyme S synthesis regulatory protein ExsA